MQRSSVTKFHASLRLTSCLLAAAMCALGLGRGVAAAEPAPAAARRVEVLLEQMSEALRARNYEGTLVYLRDNRMETLSLVHRVDQGQVKERLISLSGPVRALTQQPDRVMCVFPDGHPISVARQGRARLLDTEGIDPAALVDHYRIEVLGSSRVAGRDTDVVGILPRDDLRYGYRFHLDRDSHLPLKADLVDVSGDPLEQLMFTAISLQSSDTPASGGGEPSLRTAPPTDSPGRWQFVEPPRGFQLVMYDTRQQPDGTMLEHFMFTDRLSSYSLYIESGAQDGLSGPASIGAVHAVGRKVSGYQVTVVGEVPAQTVEAAVSGVRLRSGPEDGG